jgi:hypothetical protein
MEAIRETEAAAAVAATARPARYAHLLKFSRNIE